MTIRILAFGLCCVAGEVAATTIFAGMSKAIIAHTEGRVLGVDINPIIDVNAATLSWPTITIPHELERTTHFNGSFRTFIPGTFPTPGETVDEPYSITYQYEPLTWDVVTEIPTMSIRDNTSGVFFARGPYITNAPALEITGTARIEFGGDVGVMPFTISVPPLVDFNEHTLAVSQITETSVLVRKTRSMLIESGGSVFAESINVGGRTWGMSGNNSIFYQALAGFVIPEPSSLTYGLACTMLGMLHRLRLCRRDDARLSR